MYHVGFLYFFCGIESHARHNKFESVLSANYSLLTNRRYCGSCSAPEFNTTRYVTRVNE